jgi:hypothetical protein
MEYLGMKSYYNVRRDDFAHLAATPMVLVVKLEWQQQVQSFAVSFT